MRRNDKKNEEEIGQDLKSPEENEMIVTIGMMTDVTTEEMIATIGVVADVATGMTVAEEMTEVIETTADDEAELEHQREIVSLAKGQEVSFHAMEMTTTVGGTAMMMMALAKTTAEVSVGKRIMSRVIVASRCASPLSMD